VRHAQTWWVAGKEKREIPGFRQGGREIFRAEFDDALADMVTGDGAVDFNDPECIDDNGGLRRHDQAGCGG
jgi:hypothetical protein